MSDGPSSAAEFESLFDDLAGATGPGVGWAGGHLAGSVLLPDGRRVWLFGPLQVRPAGGAGGDASATVMLQNGFVLQREHALGPILVGGAAERPHDLVPAYGADQLLRPVAAVVEGRALKVLFGRFRSTGPGWWDVQRTGTTLAEFELPGLTLTSLTDLPTGALIGWGAAVLVEDGFTYVYGTSTGPARMTFAHVARARTGDLAGAWEFWDGVDWAVEERHAARLLSGVGHGFAVCRALRAVVVVSEEHHRPADRRLVIRVSGFPQGRADHPFSHAGLLVEPEGVRPGEAVHSAAVHLVVEPTGDTSVDPPPASTVVVSYHVSAAEGREAPEDVGRPRFVDLHWPAFDSQADVAAPGRVTATGQDGHVDLGWDEVPAASGYRVRMRDVTAGQIGYTLLPEICTTTGSRIDGLIDGHQYRFTVASITADGEGEPGPAVEVTPHSTVPVEQAVVGANRPMCVPDDYVVLLQGRAAHRERIADHARTFARETGAELHGALLHTLQGFALEGLMEQQAVDLAAHPDVRVVEQNGRGFQLGTGPRKGL